MTFVNVAWLGTPQCISLELVTAVVMAEGTDKIHVIFSKITINFFFFFYKTCFYGVETITAEFIKFMHT